MKVRIILCLVFFLVSCSHNNSQNTEVLPIPIPQPTQTELEKFEKTARIENEKYVSRIEINEESKFYGLSALAIKKLPKNDLEIRIWRFSAFGDKHVIFILKRTNESWSADLVQRTIDKKYILSDSSEKKPLMKYSRKQLEKPKLGWKELWQKLNSANILTLPDGSKVGNLCDPDCWSFVVEAKVQGAYRVYQYYSPEYDKSPEAKQLVKVVNLISEEFNLNDFDENNFLKP